MALAATVLSLGNDRMRRLFIALVPLSAVALLFDSMRLLKKAGFSSKPVHLCDFRALEMAAFGVTSQGHRGTVHDFGRRIGPCARPHFAPCPTAFSLRRAGVRGLPASPRFHCAAALRVGLLGAQRCRLRHLSPLPGCPTLVLSRVRLCGRPKRRPSAGPNLLRVDAMLGIGYFRAFYGRASDVFGALPSLHVAYPLL